MADASDLQALTTPRTVEVGDVSDALRDLWGQADAETGEESGQAVVRACGLTVIALAEGEGDLSRLMAQVGEATAAVPARTVLIQIDAEVEGGLSAEVSAFCTLGPGGRQVCHEQVVLRASRARREDLPPLITPLPVSDLPVVLLLARPDLLRTRLVERLLPVVDVLLTDSARSDDPDATLGDLLRLRDRRGMVGLDLAFERLGPWRDAIAGAWDRARAPGLRLDRVEATFHGRDPGAALLLGWIESRLADCGHPEVRLTSSEATADGGESRAIRLEFHTDQGSVCTQLRQYGQHVTEVGSDQDSIACALPRPLLSDVEVLVRILNDPQDDPVYAEALRAAVDRIPPK